MSANFNDIMPVSTDANDMTLTAYEYAQKLRTDMAELAAALAPDDRQKLYELLHDAYNCRMFK